MLPGGRRACIDPGARSEPPFASVNLGYRELHRRISPNFGNNKKAAALFRLVDVSSLEQEEQAFAHRLDELRRQRPAVLPVGMHCLLQGSEEGGSEAESSEDGVGGGGNGNPGAGGAINEVGSAGNGTRQVGANSTIGNVGNGNGAVAAGGGAAGGNYNTGNTINAGFVGVGGGGGTTTSGETATRMEIDAGGVTTTQQDAAEGAQPRS